METASTEVTSIRRRKKKKSSTWRTHQYFVDFENWINVKMSTSNRCHNFHVDSPFKMDVISTNFPRGISTSNRWRIEEDMSIGNVGATLKLRHKMQRPHNVSTTASNSKRCTKIAATLDNKFTSQHIMDVVMAMSIHLCNRNSVLRRCTSVASALQRTKNVAW